MVYDFDSAKQGDTILPSAGEIIKDSIEGRYKSFLYGLKQNAPLEFNFVFGPNMESIDAHDPPDRWEIEAIASWLTGHDEYMWLEIEQPDLETVRYRCIVTELKLLASGLEPWAFSCKVSCDSPFAYLYPETFTYNIPGARTVNLFSRSAYSGYYMPKLDLRFSGGSSISIINTSDNSRIFEFRGLPTGSPLSISVDNENMVITNSLGLDLYPYFNMNFFRLKRGDNNLIFAGNCNVSIICEFPANIGG